ncbi:MAG: hypothetical protein KO463_01415 [Candidatus Methanofastidiosa archaeon]|nr:hypothetical protein [Candidatus Methanofastidiosa archaeon]
MSGPELGKSRIDYIISAIMRAASDLLRDFEVGACPAVNIVYCVAGSLGEPDWDHGRVVRFSRKKQLILVHSAVPREVVQSADPLEYLIMELHGANALAFEYFRKRGIDFPLREAEALVQAIRRRVISGDDMVQ